MDSRIRQNAALRRAEIARFGRARRSRPSSAPGGACMTSQDVYGPRYWSVTIYQARLLFFLPPEYARLRSVKDRAEAAGSLSLKKVNWEKLNVLGLLEVDRTRRSWVLVRRGPLWQPFWDRVGLSPDPDAADAAAQLACVDAAFAHSSKTALTLPPEA
jgi:hypothetical protein